MGVPFVFYFFLIASNRYTVPGIPAEASKHTSVQRRIENARHTQLSNRIDQQPELLLPFAGNPRESMPVGLPFRLTDYLELVDWIGRILREDRKGAIPEELPDILQRLQLDARHWCYLTRNFEHPFKRRWVPPITCVAPARHSVSAGCRA